MIHLIGFTPDSPQRQAFEALYQKGDVCVGPVHVIGQARVCGQWGGKDAKQ